MQQKKLVMDIKEKIVVGAEKLFHEKGFKSVTMDFLAKSMSMSKRTIYENYTDKNELIKAVINRRTATINQNLFKLLLNANNVFDAMCQFGEMYHEQMKSFNPVIAEDLKKYYSDILRESKRENDETNLKIVNVMLTKGVQEGSFDNKLNIDIACRTFSMLTNYMHELSEEYTNKNDIFYSCFIPYIKGICTPQGKELLNDTMKRLSIMTENK